ncbi:hypothetical protein BCR35DRAFT_352010 [Leucosporidium creatinivorum]|uniref:BZIP domain-containing protein n=1 Tax=Leucosporidium creatinivorum TaxID=106004 RepID=A0A1Y2FI00_9BASI|nr:hypothetical protein BCR35DRAFT_352010 [Leucosporidium creatinivorum]
MAGRPTSEEATRALQSLLAAAFPNGHAPSSDSIPYPTSNHLGSTSSSGNEDSLQNSGDGTPQEELLQALSAISNGTSDNTSLLHSHTMALLAAQPGLLPGLTFAPPSPGPRTRAASASLSAAAQRGPSQGASYYTPLPTRSGRVPQVPDPTAAEPARETMLFNDYFDWPSSDDEDDPDFQPQAAWSDIVVGQGGGVFSADEDGDDLETDFSAVDEGFIPGDALLSDGLGLGHIDSDDILVGAGGASTSRVSMDAFALPGPSTRASRAPASSSSPAPFAPPPPPPPKTKSKTTKTKASTSTRGRKRPRTTLSPLPEDPVDEDLFVAPPPPAPTASSSYIAVDSPAPPPGSTSVMKSFYGVGTPGTEPPTPAPHSSAPTPSAAPTPIPLVASAPVTTPKPPIILLGGQEKVGPDGVVRKVRGKGRKSLQLTDEQLEEQKREKNRLGAKATRERKKRQLKGHEMRVRELEVENGELKRRIEELERENRELRADGGGQGTAQGEDGGVVVDESVGTESRDGNWEMDSVADSVEDDGVGGGEDEEVDQLDEDGGEDAEMAHEGGGGGGHHGGNEHSGGGPAFDLSGLSAEGLEELRKLLLIAAKANGSSALTGQKRDERRHTFAFSNISYPTAIHIRLALPSFTPRAFAKLAPSARLMGYGTACIGLSSEVYGL